MTSRTVADSQGPVPDSKFALDRELSDPTGDLFDPTKFRYLVVIYGRRVDLLGQFKYFSPVRPTARARKTVRSLTIEIRRKEDRRCVCVLTVELTRVSLSLSSVTQHLDHTHLFKINGAWHREAEVAHRRCGVRYQLV